MSPMWSLISGTTGSSTKNGRYGSRRGSTRRAIGAVSRPWKSTAMSNSSPTASLTEATRSTIPWTAAGVSISRSCAEAFILIAVKPSPLRARASDATSSGRSPPIQLYTRARSRTLPPRSCHTGTPRALPVMSQRAWSIPATALERTGPPR